jgi:hypothetical protein
MAAARVVTVDPQPRARPCGSKNKTMLRKTSLGSTVRYNKVTDRHEAGDTAGPTQERARCWEIFLFRRPA